MLLSQFKIFLISLMYLLATQAAVIAQGISGPNIVNLDAVERYEVDMYGYSSAGWGISGGATIIAEAPDHSWIDVKFDIAGPFSVSVLLFDGNSNTEYILDGEVITQFSPGSIEAATPLIDAGWQTLTVNNLATYSGGPGCPFGQYSYGWDISYDSQVWIEIAGSVGTSASWQITRYIDRTIYVRRRVILCHGTYYSNVIEVNIADPLTAGRIGVSQVVSPGATPQAINNEALPTGGSTGSYAYQWESSTDQMNWQVIAGSTGTGYQPGAVSGTVYYRRKVTSGAQYRYSNKVRIIAKQAVARNTPVPVSPPSGSQPVLTIPSYTGISGADLNKVHHYGVEKPGILTQTQLVAETIGNQVKKSTAYLDGMGRSIQMVNVKASPGAKDVVSLNVYDQFGRETAFHLPYIAATTTQNTGAFRTDANTEQPAFLKQLMGADKDYFYSRLLQEDASLSRWTVGQQFGKNFTGKNIGSREETRFNTENDKVRIWEIGDDPAALPSSPGFYSPGMLAVTETTTEEGETSLAYTNRGGDIVCIRVLPALTTGEGEGLTTYFVYNELRQNRFEIPPLAVKYCLQKNVWNLNQHDESRAVAKDLCYRSVYNEKGLLIRSQKPGAQYEEEYIYDSRGRLVFIRNAQLRSRNLGEWIVFFYDELDRPVITALYTNPGATYSSLLALANQAGGTSQVQVSTPAPQDIYVENRDGNPVKYEASGSITVLPGFESEAGAEIEMVISPAMPPLNESFIASNPVPGITQYKVLALYYYDNYKWQGAKRFSSAFQLDAGTNPYPQPVAERIDARGLVTGVKTAVLGQERMLTTVLFYDEKGNPIQQQRENIAGGVDIETVQYDFSGKVLSRYLRHQNPGSPGTPELKLRTAYSYDPAGRMLSTRQTIFKAGGDITKELTTFSYDEAGRIVASTLGTLETLNYTYGPQGNLEGINAEYARNGSGSHYFGMELKYDLGFAKSRQDGQLAGVTWRRKGDPDEWHAFGYDYDGASRLTKADYSQQGGGTWTNTAADFDVKIPAYDENGNVINMSQNGMLLGNVKAELDNLTYQYDKNGFSNRLLKVTDSKGDKQQGDFKDVNDSENDYTYDDNGSLLRDRNRGITIINDFLLNKPLRISMDADATKSVEYVYSFDGSKLKQTVKSGGTTTTYVYIGGFVYKNNELQLFPHEAGRVRRNANGEFVFDYFIPDQLGNIRTVITEESNIAYYKATHEDNPQPVPAIPEREAFSFPQQVDVIPAGHKLYDYNGVTNRKFVKLNSSVSSRKIGTSKVLRVMAGDVVETGVYSYYQQNSPANNVPNDPVSTILSQLINVLLGPSTTVINNGHGNLLQSNSNQNILNTTDITDFITDNQQQNPPSQVPKAYLNYVLFDDNFKMVSGGAVRVSSPDVVAPLAATMNVQKNGYLYVYISNESPSDVYFDDLVVKHTTGHLLQEDTYYPFGLGIRALSSKALNRLENKYLFNGIEQLTEFDLEIYDALYRNLDPQTGRWWQRDPKQDKYLSQSPYGVNGNNPVNFSDPLGDDYFRSPNGMGVRWLDSHAATEIIDGQIYTNIGPIISRWVGKGLDMRFEMYINGSLAYAEDLMSTHFYQTGPFLTQFTDFATPYYKGQLPFILWMKDLAKYGAIDGLRNDLFHYNLSQQANYDRGILGGTPASTEDKIRINTNLQLIPTLREAYLKASNPGIDLLNYRRNLTMLTNEEVSDVAIGTAVQLVPLWIGQVPSAWAATRSGFSMMRSAEARSIAQAEMSSLSFSSENLATKGGEQLLLGAGKFPRFDFKFGKHAPEWAQWGSISKTAYYNRAVSLAESQVGGKIMGFTSKQGWTFRFNSATGEFLTTHPNGYIETFFRPTGGMDYYLKQVQLYGH